MSRKQSGYWPQEGVSSRPPRPVDEWAQHEPECLCVCAGCLRMVEAEPVTPVFAHPPLPWAWRWRRS